MAMPKEENATTTLEVPVALRDRLRRLKAHSRQAYHEIIAAGLDALETVPSPNQGPGLDPLVSRHRQRLLRLAHENRITALWLFGSRARGDAKPGSDVDLLYELAPGASLWDVSGFLADARELLGVRVDVASKAGLSPRLRERVLGEAVQL